MAKRFTDTNKYKKPFIRGLKGAYKLLWDYLYHECDHAGIWIVDFEVAQLYIGADMQVNESDALSAFNASEIHIVPFDKGKKWFIPEFVEYQYGELGNKNRVHQSVISILKKDDLLKFLAAENLKIKEEDVSNTDNTTTTTTKNKDLISPLEGLKDKDKDKDKDKEQEGGVGETEIAPESAQEIFIPDEEFEAACQYVKTSRVQAFQVLMKNNSKTEKEMFALLRIFIEQKIALDEIKGRTQKQLIDNFFFWIPKHLSFNSRASSSEKDAPAGKVQSLVKIASKVQYRG